PAKILKISKTKVHQLTDNVTLTCNVTGDPRPSISWTKANYSSPLTPPKFQLSNYNQSLTIMNITLQEQGTYICNATNKYASVRRNVTVNVEEQHAKKAYFGEINSVRSLRCACVIYFFNMPPLVALQPSTPCNNQNRNVLSPEILQTLVSTVAAEVTRQMATILPAQVPSPVPTPAVPALRLMLASRPVWLLTRGSNGGLPASFCLEPAAKPTKILNIEAWLQAFHIFVGVYTQRYPVEAPALMKYGQTIQDLAARGLNWRFYDENFRFLRQTQRTLVPWGSIHGELWLRSQYSMTRKSSGPQVGQNNFAPKPRSPTAVPWGYCFKFHRGQSSSVVIIFVALTENRPPIPTAPPSQVLPTPVKIQPLIELLSGYEPSIINTLISGFSFGFPLNYQGDIKSIESKNLTSALQYPKIVDMKLDKELAANRLAGPFSSPPFNSFCVSPLGLVPKKTPGEFRLIHHLSFPKGVSVNDGIPSESTSVHYATVSDAIRLIKRAGPGCFLAKTDIKNTFRIMPIHSEDYHLLGMKWWGLYYFDRCMPMGCSSSCKTFDIFSTAVEWIAQHKFNIDKLLHLLDDFLLIAATHTQCRSNLDRFLNLCAILGIPIAPEKTCGPATTLTFAGIELDSVKSQARLPADKLAKCTLQVRGIYTVRAAFEERRPLPSFILPGYTRLYTTSNLGLCAWSLSAYVLGRS
ncbi:Cortactin-binding 2, partial [Paramuricea clavata]